MIDYIHTQLSIWARWSIAQSSKALGYAPICPMFKDARHGGAFGSRPPTGVEIGSIHDIHDMDKAVRRLSDDHKRLVVEFYVVGGKSVEIAARLGVPKRTMYDRIALMHQQVMGHLNDVAAGC